MDLAGKHIVLDERDDWSDFHRTLAEIDEMVARFARTLDDVQAWIAAGMPVE